MKITVIFKKIQQTGGGSESSHIAQGKRKKRETEVNRRRKRSAEGKIKDNLTRPQF